MAWFPPSRSLPTQCPWLPSHLIRYNVNYGLYATCHCLFSWFFQVSPSRYLYSTPASFQILSNSSSLLRWYIVELLTGSGNSSVVIVTGLTTGICFPLEAGDFSFLLHSVQIDPEAHPASYQMVTGDFSPGHEPPGHEADRSPPSSAEVKNGGAIPPPLHTSSWNGAFSSTGTLLFMFYLLISPWAAQSIRL
jgi:hypothetical protein